VQRCGQCEITRPQPNGCRARQGLPRAFVSKRGIVSARGVLARGGTVVNLRAIVFVNGRLTKQTSADDKAKSPASGLAPVRSHRRPISIALTNATRGKCIAAALASTAPSSSKIAEDRRQARRVSSQLDLFVTASLLGGRATIGFEFACKPNRTIHLTPTIRLAPTLWAAGQLPAAA
jgi:hypothetical protein